MNEANVTHDVISSDRVEGTSVFNHDGEKLGTISHLIIDKKSGQVRFAVMEFGGLLGVGGDRFPIPWDLLQYDTAKDGCRVPIDKATRADAPRHPVGDLPRYDDAYDSSVRTYYGF